MSTSTAANRVRARGRTAEIIVSRLYQPDTRRMARGLLALLGSHASNEGAIARQKEKPAAGCSRLTGDDTETAPIESRSRAHCSTSRGSDGERCA
jgi:hypothetical protein